MNIQINITDTRITITGEDRASMISRLLDFVTSPSSPTIVHDETVKPVERKKHFKQVDYPERFTILDLAKHLCVSYQTAYWEIQKGLRSEVIELIGKKHYGKLFYQRRDAKQPMVISRPMRQGTL